MLWILGLNTARIWNVYTRRPQFKSPLALTSAASSPRTGPTCRGCSPRRQQWLRRAILAAHTDVEGDSRTVPASALTEQQLLFLQVLTIRPCTDIAGGPCTRRADEGTARRKWLKLKSLIESCHGFFKALARLERACSPSSSLYFTPAPPSRNVSAPSWQL